MAITNKKKIDIFRDIADMVKDDKEHCVRIETEYMVLRVLLDYIPDDNWEDNFTIPIEYTTLEEFAYIPQDKLVEIYKPFDFGIDSKEIKLIDRIMTYMEQNGKEIAEILHEFDEPKERNIENQE